MNLADVYSFIDSKKRAVKGLLAEPGLTLQQYISQIGEDNDKRLNLQANAYPMAGDKTVLNSPHQLDQFRAQLAKEGSDMAMAGMFVGPSSKTWDKVSAQKATQMEKSGADARKIWSDTGTWKAPDGMWRQEIPDNNASITNRTTLLANDRASVKAELDRLVSNVKQSGLKPTNEQKFQANMLNMRQASTSYKGNISEAFQHEDLYKAYPDVAKTDFQWIAMPAGEGGQYSPREGVLLNGGLFGKEAESLTSHELQHAIQHREGFAKGGSPESMQPYIDDYANTKKNFDRALKQSMSDADPIAAANAAQERQFYGLQLGKMSNIKGADKNELYRRLAGEAEARATQTRIPLDAAQRRATFPEDSYDTPIGQLIMRFQSQ